MAITIRVNERSISAKLDAAEEAAEKKVKSRFKEIAEDLSDRSPVDTGAYAESFSVGDKTRSRTSKGRPRKQSVSQYRQIAYNTMVADIEGLQLLDWKTKSGRNKSIPFRNRAPHARYIEGVYQTFNIAKDKNR